MSLSMQRSVLSFSRAFNPKPVRGYGPHLSTHLGLLVLRLHLQGCRIRLVPAVDYQDSAEDYKEIWVALRVVFLDDPFISELASHRCHFTFGTISGCHCHSSLGTYTMSSAVDPQEDPQEVFRGRSCTRLTPIRRGSAGSPVVLQLRAAHAVAPSSRTPDAVPAGSLGPYCSPHTGRRGPLAFLR